MLFAVVLFLTFVLSVTAQKTHYKHGPTFGWRRARKPYIVSASTTLTPGPPPNPARPRLAVWPGMDTPGGLIQPIIVSTSPNEYRQCGAKANQWCVFASYLKYPSSQKMGKIFAMDGNAALTMNFKWNDAVNGYSQQLFVKGKMMSEISAQTGKAKGWYTDVECQGTHTGVISAHKYTNTTIVLSEPDAQWGNSPSNHMMACADKISSPDGGKTWVIPTIKVSESVAMRDYEGKNKPGPIICGGA